MEWWKGGDVKGRPVKLVGGGEGESVWNACVRCWCWCCCEDVGLVFVGRNG